MRKILFILALVLVFSPSGAGAQSAPEVLLTWKAHTYAPPYYSGKNLPTGLSVITASVAAVEKGLFTDLSNQTVYWYVNGNFLQGGKGILKVSFQAPELAEDVVDLRVELPDMDVLKTVEVPVVQAKSVIETRVPGGNFSRSPFSVWARPFFFNVINPSSLKIHWTVNGERVAAAERPEELVVTLLPDTPPGFSVGLEAVWSNPRILLEGARRTVRLIFSP